MPFSFNGSHVPNNGPQVCHDSTLISRGRMWLKKDSTGLPEQKTLSSSSLCCKHHCLAKTDQCLWRCHHYRCQCRHPPMFCPDVAWAQQKACDRFVSGFNSPLFSSRSQHFQLCRHKARQSIHSLYPCCLYTLGFIPTLDSQHEDQQPSNAHELTERESAARGFWMIHYCTQPRK